jgi:hypothetical protein
MKHIIAFATLAAAMPTLAVNLSSPAHASCTRSYADCDRVVVLACPGGVTFVGGSDQGSALDIARIKARAKGYDPTDCRVRRLPGV